MRGGMRHTVVLILGFMLVALVMACGGTAEPALDIDATLESAPSEFDFPISLYQGEDVIGSRQFSFASLLGDTPIVLNYWASNCPPCSAEMPEFQKVYEAYEGRVLFFGLDVGGFAGFGGLEDSKKELRRLGVTYPAGPAPDIETVRNLRVRGLPSTDFITSDGKIIRSWTGILNESKLTEFVESLIDES